MTHNNTRRQRYTILLVEDESSIRRFTKAVLESAGYVVVEAVDAREARHQYANGGIDFVLTDSGLPDQAGEELIRSLSPSVPFLVVSGGGNCNRPHDWPFLPKPFKPEQLLAAVISLIECPAPSSSLD